MAVSLVCLCIIISAFLLFRVAKVQADLPNLSGNGLNGPVGLAVVNNTIWVTNKTNNSISFFTSKGKPVLSPIFPVKLKGIQAITLVGSEIWIVGTSNNAIFRLQIDGTYIGAITGNGLNSPQDIIVSGSSVFVPNYTDGTISKFNTDGSGAGIITLPITNIVTMDVVKDTVWTMKANDPNIYRFTLDGRAAPVVTTSLTSPSFLRVISNQVWVTDLVKNAIYRFDLNGKLIGSAITDIGLNEPGSMVVVDYSQVWVANKTSNAISRINMNQLQNPPLISRIAKRVRVLQKRKFKSACSLQSGTKRAVRCLAQIATENDGIKPYAIKATSLDALDALGGPYTPDVFHIAYQLPCTPGGHLQANCPQPASFGSQTIAIVDAYGDPTVESDLANFDGTFGLPSCTKANGCLQVVDQNGGTNYPPADPGWIYEISLDVQTAHAICQTCKILLVEAKSSYLSDIYSAVDTAVRMGATEISNSYGVGEDGSEPQSDLHFNHPGIAVIASSGDSAYQGGTEYPASSPYVLSVGGTTLTVNTDGTYNNEAVWYDSSTGTEGGGSGCSQSENAIAEQVAIPNWSSIGCHSFKAVADISADADPNTGIIIYVTDLQYGGNFYAVGGTSFSSPLIAGVMALAGGVPVNTQVADVVYKNYGKSHSYFNDVVNGSNGNCSTSICRAGIGYDGPTGLGTPIGVSGFSSIAATPTSPPAIVGDVNKDGCVSQGDLTAWQQAYLNSGTPSDPTYSPDLNNDGKVDLADFAISYYALATGVHVCN